MQITHTVTLTVCLTDAGSHVYSVHTGTNAHTTHTFKECTHTHTHTRSRRSYTINYVLFL